MGERGINRAQIRHGTHVNLVGAYGHHGGGGSAFQWHQRHQFFAVTPYQINHAQGLDAAAAIAFDENVDFVVIADVFEQVVERQYIVATNAAAWAVPITHQRCAQMSFDVGDGLLGFGKQTRRLFDAWADVGFIAVALGFVEHEHSKYGAVET